MHAGKSSYIVSYQVSQPRCILHESSTVHLLSPIVTPIHNVIHLDNTTLVLLLVNIIVLPDCNSWDAKNENSNCGDAVDLLAVTVRVVDGGSGGVTDWVFKLDESTSVVNCEEFGLRFGWQGAAESVFEGC